MQKNKNKINANKIKKKKIYLYSFLRNIFKGKFFGCEKILKKCDA